MRRFWRPALSARRSRATLVALFAVLFSLLGMAPYVIHVSHPSYRGMTVIRDKDFGYYFSRLQRSLSGFPGEAANGITPVGSGIEGVQGAGAEAIVGTLFGWTGIPAPPLGIILSGIFTGLSFACFFLLFRTIGQSFAASLCIAVAYYAILLHVLSRVINPGWTFVPTFAGLACFFAFCGRPTALRAVAAGLLLALLPYLYLWSWFFAWASAGTMAALLLAFRRGDPSRKKFLALLPLVAGSLLLSLPAIIGMVSTIADPLGPELYLRSGLLISHAVESPPRSILALAQVVALLSLFRSQRSSFGYLAAVALLLGTFAAMHQNVLHGRLLMFSSHLYPHLVAASLAAGAWAARASIDVFRKAVIVAIAGVFLLGAAKDYLPGYRFLVPSPRDFANQHLLEAVARLRNGRREVVLTDGATGRVVTAWTDDGVVYASHVRLLRIDDANVAERYCVSELFSPETPDPYRAIYMDYNAVLDSDAVRSRERDLVSAACEKVRRSPLEYMRKYGVTHILWNRSERPQWRTDRYAGLPMSRTAEGEAWVLYELR